MKLLAKRCWAMEMLATLLTTKLHIPSPRPELVSRPRLIEQLNAGLDRKLTLVSAPAGFGKTTLLSDWAINCERPVAWLTLDEADNDLARFLPYFVASLQTIEASQDTIGSIGEGVLSAFQSPRPPQIESVLTALINEIVAAPTPFVVILDDYHLITTRPIHDALTFLLDHLPPNMHLVIASRTDPPLPVALLRGRGQVTEFRQSDLRFTPDETTAFLNEAMSLELSADEVAALTSRTEGWIAGLQMAAVSMHGLEDVADFVQAFAGSNRYVLDYLLEEVLQRQSDSVQAFLLQTSVLDRLTGPLCEAIIRQGEGLAEPALSEAEELPTSGQATLQMLERSNLFIEPLNHEGRWYRYHRLFADLLRQRLQQAHPDLPARLHLRASEWYERNGLMAQAIDHALSAGDFERASQLVEEAAESNMMRSEIATLQRWVEALPARFLRARPLLGVYHATMLLLSGHPLDVAEARMEEAVEADTGGILSGELLAFRGLIAAYRGEPSESAKLARRALELLPEERLFFRTLVAGYLGFVHLHSGDYVAASEALSEAVRIGQKVGSVAITVLAKCHLAELAALRGQFREARDIYEHALESAFDDRGRRQPIAGLPLIGLGGLLAEWNDLEHATRHLLDGIDLLKRYGEAAAIGGYVSLSRVKLAQGDATGAMEALQTAEDIAMRFDAMKTDDMYVAARKAHLAAAQGDMQTALRWIEERGFNKEISADELLGEEGSASLPPFRAYDLITLAQVRIAQGQPDNTLAVLEPLLRRAESTKNTTFVIRILVLRALALQAMGDADPALAALERALSLAAPGGFVRVFVDEGEPMARLLRDAASRGIAPAYVARLLAALDVSEYKPMKEPRSDQRLIEPLSERELEVLRLLTTSLSSTEMAEELIISVNTVRSHIRNIYSKLDVHSRYEAVARAREIDLL